MKYSPLAMPGLAQSAIEGLASYRNAVQSCLFPHAINQVAQFCTRAILMERGLVISDGSISKAVVKYESLC